jgi:hypothetical protein
MVTVLVLEVGTWVSANAILRLCIVYRLAIKTISTTQEVMMRTRTGIFVAG